MLDGKHYDWIQPIKKISSGSCVSGRTYFVLPRWLKAREEADMIACNYCGISKANLLVHPLGLEVQHLTGKEHGVRFVTVLTATATTMEIKILVLFAIPYNAEWPFTCVLLAYHSSQRLRCDCHLPWASRLCRKTIHIFCGLDQSDDHLLFSCLSSREKSRKEQALVCI